MKTVRDKLSTIQRRTKVIYRMPMHVNFSLYFSSFSVVRSQRLVLWVKISEQTHGRTKTKQNQNIYIMSLIDLNERIMVASIFSRLVIDRKRMLKYANGEQTIRFFLFVIFFNFRLPRAFPTISQLFVRFAPIGIAQLVDNWRRRRREI